MRRAMRAFNIGVALLALASGLAVLASIALEPGYREAHGDSVLLVVAYLAWQALVVREFARDSWLVPWLAVAKTLAAYAFLLTLNTVGPLWIGVTPGRYVYQLFHWGEGAEIGMLAFLTLGRGAWNTLNALYFTQPWWQPLRQRRPFLGRVVTAVAIAIVVCCVWSFRELVRVGRLRDVARVVYDGLTCDAIRARDGQTTTDVRQPAGGGARYTVRIVWGCALTRVFVADEDGRVATVAGRRPECCAPSS